MQPLFILQLSCLDHFKQINLMPISRAHEAQNMYILNILVNLQESLHHTHHRMIYCV